SVELDGLHHHLRQAERPAELPHETGRVERRAAREIGSLAEEDVLPAEPREPVQDRRPAHASSDDDGARARSHAGASLRSSAARNPSSKAVRSSRAKWLSAYATKSKSSSEIPCWTSPHIASRKSDMKRIRTSASRSAARDSRK